MTNNDKVPDIQKQASKIVVEAYKKGGRVYYKDIKHIVTVDINAINNVLRNYGKLNVLLIDGSWNSFDIDYSGMKLKGKDIPEIFKKKKRGVWGKILIGIFIGVSVYFVIQLILWIAGRIGS